MKGGGGQETAFAGARAPVVQQCNSGRKSFDLGKSCLGRKQPIRNGRNSATLNWSNSR
ncbi:hypothetical protein GL4_2153 [Methyloceanibacter caenitepidi]|uniref:Uncharacterized protein n=1 Tax=Methyloceanibacter caenitepidi TaxID=1384459 RepID=A0A0A8K476_9HYPH|nr:hypothetical protein GL4_2153 [Methyloceanibacter caenitepidi]